MEIYIFGSDNAGDSAYFVTLKIRNKRKARSTDKPKESSG